jgi:hypothetical protein
MGCPRFGLTRAREAGVDRTVVLLPQTATDLSAQRTWQRKLGIGLFELPVRRYPVAEIMRLRAETEAALSRVVGFR